MTPEELAWLAGWLEGEGCFYLSRPKAHTSVSANSTDLDALEKVAAIAGGKIHGPRSSGKPKHKPFWYWVLGGGPAVCLMREIRPLMCSRRGAKIDEIIAWYADRPLRGDWSRKIPHTEHQRIRERVAEGPVGIGRALAAEYGVTPSTISKIVVAGRRLNSERGVGQRIEVGAI